MKILNAFGIAVISGIVFCSCGNTRVENTSKPEYVAPAAPSVIAPDSDALKAKPIFNSVKEFSDKLSSQGVFVTFSERNDGTGMSWYKVREDNFEIQAETPLRTEKIVRVELFGSDRQTTDRKLTIALDVILTNLYPNEAQVAKNVILSHINDADGFEYKGTVFGGRKENGQLYNLLINNIHYSGEQYETQW